MQKKEKNRIVLSQKAEKIVRSFCRANNRDINEFLEEAIIEKIEFDELDKDALARETGETPVVEEIYAEEPGDEGFKRKH
jgi:hypothetical protein